MRIRGGMIGSLVLSPALHIATALLVLISVVSPVRSSASISRSDRAGGISRGLDGRLRSSTRVRTRWVSARPDRLKAISTEKDDDPVGLVHRTRSDFDWPSNASNRIARSLRYFACSRASSPLRC
jgi:hypothetical protein